jgi:hypothetical protein
MFTNFEVKKEHYFRRKLEEIKLRKYSFQNYILLGDLTTVTGIIFRGVGSIKRLGGGGTGF